MARRTENVETTPEAERIGLKLARLRGRAARLDPGSGGKSTADAWRTEDGPTIAAAIGAYQQGHPRRRLPVHLVLLRHWPEAVKDHLPGMVRITTRILARRLEQMPRVGKPRIELHVTTLVRSGELAYQLLDEFRAPSTCSRCKGRGRVLRTFDEQGHHCNPVIVTCPQCNGQAEAPRGFRARAHTAGLGAYHWMQHVQPVYEVTLHGYRYLCDNATAGILRRLG